MTTDRTEHVLAMLEAVPPMVRAACVVRPTAIADLTSALEKMHAAGQAFAEDLAARGVEDLDDTHVDALLRLASSVLDDVSAALRKSLADERKEDA